VNMNVYVRDSRLSSSSHACSHGSPKSVIMSNVLVILFSVNRKMRLARLSELCGLCLGRFCRIWQSGRQKLNRGNRDQSLCPKYPGSVFLVAKKFVLM